MQIEPHCPSCGAHNWASPVTWPAPDRYTIRGLWRCIQCGHWLNTRDCCELGQVCPACWHGPPEWNASDVWER